MRRRAVSGSAGWSIAGGAGERLAVRAHVPAKPAPDLIGGGYRFADKAMRRARVCRHFRSNGAVAGFNSIGNGCRMPAMVAAPETNKDRPQQPAQSEPDNRVVVPLRPRRSGAALGMTAPAETGADAPVQDLSRYERHPDDQDDYRHRMLTNVIALFFTAALVLSGLWIANKIAEMRKNQDCVLSGKRNCTPLQIPSADR
jgi:hypothetical protein